MTKADSSAYKRGYQRGRATGAGKGEAAARVACAIADEAVARAERAEAGHGLGRCDQCARWTRGEMPPAADRWPTARWGGCRPPAARHHNGSPLWVGDPDQAILTSESFGCVLFLRRAGHASDTDPPVDPAAVDPGAK